MSKQKANTVYWTNRWQTKRS